MVGVVGYCFCWILSGMLIDLMRYILHNSFDLGQLNNVVYFVVLDNNFIGIGTPIGY